MSADLVIVAGARRGGSVLPSAEIHQMIGRAGRVQGGEGAEAFVLVDCDDFQEVDESIAEKTALDTKSKLIDVDTIAFHILPDICNGDVRTEADVQKWFSRSWAGVNGRRDKSGKVLERLLRSGAVLKIGSKVEPTRRGEIASAFYFAPWELAAWEVAFERIFEEGIHEEDAAIAWAMSAVSTGAVFSPEFAEAMEVMGERLPEGLVVEDGFFLSYCLWGAAIGMVPAGCMNLVVRQLRNDSGRIISALQRILENKERELGEIGRRIKKGLNSEISALCDSGGITKGMARWLVSVGVADVDELLERSDELEIELENDALVAFRKVISDLRARYDR